jgi:hypothetical protein
MRRTLSGPAIYVCGPLQLASGLCVCERMESHVHRQSVDAEHHRAKSYKPHPIQGICGVACINSTRKNEQCSEQHK